LETPATEWEERARVRLRGEARGGGRAGDVKEVQTLVEEYGGLGVQADGLVQELRDVEEVGGRKGGREEGRKGGREEGREEGREGGREGGRVMQMSMKNVGEC
jgi:predicted transposase YdaD